jgi:hypothetical protein
LVTFWGQNLGCLWQGWKSDYFYKGRVIKSSKGIKFGSEFGSEFGVRIWGQNWGCPESLLGSYLLYSRNLRNPGKKWVQKSGQKCMISRSKCRISRSKWLKMTKNGQKWPKIDSKMAEIPDFPESAW